MTWALFLLGLLLGMGLTAHTPMDYFVLEPQEKRCFFVGDFANAYTLEPGDKVIVSYKVLDQDFKHLLRSNVEFTFVRFDVEDANNNNNNNNNNKEKSGEIYSTFYLEPEGIISLMVKDKGIFSFCAENVRRPIFNSKYKRSVHPSFDIRIKRKNSDTECSFEDEVKKVVSSSLRRIQGSIKSIKTQHNQAIDQEKDVQTNDFTNYRSIPYLAILDILIYAGTAAFVTFRIIRFFKLKKVA